MSTGAVGVTTEPPEPARTPNRSLNRPKVALAIIIGVFIVLGAVIAWKTPAWESDDEPDHVQNIEALAAGHWFGPHFRLGHIEIFGHVVGVITSKSGTEAHQPPLYYALLAGWQRLAQVQVRAPDAGPSSLAPVPGGEFLHHGAASHRFLLWLRLPNVLFGALTILFTFLSAATITKDSWTPVVAASFVAFLPRFVFLSAFVTNDNLVNLLGAVLVFAALRYVAVPTRGRMVGVGVVVGLLVMTKLSALPLGAVVVVLALLRENWIKRAQYVALGCGAAIVTSGAYLIQNTYRYGSPLALGATQRFLSYVGGLGTYYGVPVKTPDPIKHILLDVPGRFIDIFWYGSGWSEYYRWPWPVGLACWVALGLALIGLIRRPIARRTLVVLGVIATASLLCVWIVAFQTYTYDPRLALAGVSALACLAALGLERSKLGVRFLLPVAGLGGVLFAIQTNVLAVHWS